MTLLGVEHALAFSSIPYPHSPLRTLDPRWKLGGLVVALLSVSLLRTLPVAATALILSLLLAWTARIPRRWYLLRLATVGFFLAFFLVPLPFLVDGSGQAWSWGPLRVSFDGLTLALFIAAKAGTILTLVLVLLTSAPLEETLDAAHALRMPGLFVQLAVLTYRYIFVLSSELARLRVALRVRGYRNRADRHSYRTVGHVAGTLLVRGYERAERVGQAMRSRGFTGRFHSLAEFHTNARDVASFLLVAVTVMGLLAWDVWGR